MSDNKSMMLLDLQLFAEGAGGAAGSSGASATAQTADAGQLSGVNREGATAAAGGDNAAQDAAVQGDQGKQEVSGARSEGERKAAYAKLKADFQDLFDNEVQGIVRERLRKPNAKVKEMMPLMDKLSVRYGTEPGDVKALEAAVDADRFYLSAKAEETGTTEEIQAELEKYRAREATQKREAREVETARRGAELTAQAKATKAIYPSFDLNAEMRNPQFTRLLDANVDVRTAYEVTHRRELQRASAQYVARQAAQRSAQKAEDNLTAHVRANGMRPLENGAKGTTPTTPKVDITKLSKEQIDDYIRRAKNGERITFG